MQFDPRKPSRTSRRTSQCLKSSQAEIEQVHAQGGLTEEADTTAVMKAKYDVEVAKLEASKSRGCFQDRRSGGKAETRRRRAGATPGRSSN